MSNFLLSLQNYFIPNLESKKFYILSVLFFLIIGTYWFFRPIKDGVFISLLGTDYLPYAKIISVLVIFPVIAGYGKLVDNFSRDKVFYIISICFAILALIFAYLIQHPIYGIYSTEPSFIKMLIGMSLAIYVKIFGSVMVAIFWSFVADVTTPQEAQIGYPIISLGGQIGNVIGPLFVGFFAKNLGAPLLTTIGAFFMFMLVPIMYYFLKTIPEVLLKGFIGKNYNQVKHKKLGLISGFKFLFSNPYLLSIYVTISIFEIIQAIFDFRFKCNAANNLTGDELVSFLGKFGALTGLVAIGCLFFGTTKITKYFGLKFALLILPIVLIILSIFNVTNNLHVAMWVLVITRAVNYALNQPSKEQLYITTSKEAKYKAKAWIEIFGTRTSEGVAQIVNLSKSLFGSHFVFFSTSLSIVLSLIWILLAKLQGNKYKKSVEENKFIC